MKIKHKLLLTFGLLMVLALAIVGINFMTYQTLENDSNFVNYSGKLRATSFKLAQLSNVVVGTNDSKAISDLEKGINLFDEILHDVQKGNSEKGLVALKHKETIMQLESIANRWNTVYKPAYVNIMENKDASTLTSINADVAQYVDTINTMVTGYSEYSNSKVSAAKMTNILLIFLVILIGTISFVLLNKGIRKPINALMVDLKDLSEGNGDLTKRIEIVSKDEIADMTHYFNRFVGNIHEIVIEIANISAVLSDNMNSIANTTEELTKSTEMIAVSSMDVAEGSMLQNNKLDELNHLVMRIKQNIESVSNKAQETLLSSEKSQESVINGDRQVLNQSNELNRFVESIKQASHTVVDLNQSSEEIKAIVELIHRISSQTNLLALNASIEAARAGEAGRGFSVVADEIRKLAEETSVSAEKISVIVSNIGDKTSNVKVSMEDLVDKTKLQEQSMEILKLELKEILNRTEITLNESQAIMGISDQVNREFSIMSLSANEIKTVAVQNSGNTQDVASAVQEQTASFEEVSANIGTISDMAEELTKIVGRFKI